MAEPLLTRISALHGPFVNWVAVAYTALTGVAAATFFAAGLPVYGAVLAALAAAGPVLWLAGGYVELTRSPSLLELVVRHLGWDWRKGTAITHPVPVRDRVNLQLALNALVEKGPDGPAVYGVEGYYHSILQLVPHSPPRVPVRWTALPKSLTETEPCVENAVFFLRTPGGVPAVAYAVPGRLDLLARSADEAAAARAALLGEAAARSVYRGRVLSVEPPDPTQHTDPDYLIRFHDLPAVARAEIVLPEDVLAVVERNVFGLLRHAEVLRRAGRGTRHGVLFHGPPGVGKTLVTKYLARACPDYTVILLTGRQLGLVRESCRLAKLLAPALVVIEDVDLIALDRNHSANTTLLHDLMDEMDGLGAKADVIFLLTTNRAEALEPALAARPGRVDQAVYFPLPDRDCRRRLFELYGRGLDLSGLDVEPLLDRTDGASPAFIQELFRKAVLFAAERGERSDPLRLSADDFAAAVRELVEFGGELTRTLLGFRGPGIGFGKK